MKDLRPSTLARAIRWTLGWEDSLEKGMATHSSILGASLVAQMVKNLPEVWETQVQSLGQKQPLEKGMNTHFLPGDSHGQRSLGAKVHRVAKSWTQLSD